MSDDLNAYKVHQPPTPRWRWCFSGDWHSLQVRTVTAPNAFHRWAQRVFLGIHWEPLP